jgi:hypothetical protein
MRPGLVDQVCKVDPIEQAMIEMALAAPIPGWEMDVLRQNFQSAWAEMITQYGTTS